MADILMLLFPRTRQTLLSNTRRDPNRRGSKDGVAHPGDEEARSRFLLHLRFIETFLSGLKRLTETPASTVIISPAHLQIPDRDKEILTAISLFIRPSGEYL